MNVAGKSDIVPEHGKNFKSTSQFTGSNSFGILVVAELNWRFIVCLSVANAFKDQLNAGKLLKMT